MTWEHQSGRPGWGPERSARGRKAELRGLKHTCLWDDLELTWREAPTITRSGAAVHRATRGRVCPVLGQRWAWGWADSTGPMDHTEQGKGWKDKNILRLLLFKKQVKYNLKWNKSFNCKNSSEDPSFSWEKKISITCTFLCASHTICHLNPQLPKEQLSL